MSKKIFVKTLFQNKIYKSNSNEFESFFQAIMSMKLGSAFTPVEVYGNIGDRKNDGYVYGTGTFYQVYGPENYEKEITQVTAINKFEKDFKGLLEHKNKGNWQSVNKFVYVINTKDVKLCPNLAKKRDELMSQYPNINIEIYTDRNLYNDFLELSTSHQEDIIGVEIPDNTDYDILNFEILKAAVDYLLKLDPMNASQEKLVVPFFEEKIEFNNLSNQNATILNRYNEYYDDLEQYFEVENIDLKEGIRSVLSSLYEEAKEVANDSDSQFMYIYKHAIDYSKRTNQGLQNAILSLMAYFFSTCDIFEEPK